jgi:hypothetical protein
MSQGIGQGFLVLLVHFSSRLLEPSMLCHLTARTLRLKQYDVKVFDPEKQIRMSKSRCFGRHALAKRTVFSTLNTGDDKDTDQTVVISVS